MEGKMTLIEIFNDIEKLAKEVRNKLGYQSLDVRRKISSIANLAAVGRANVETQQAIQADAEKIQPHQDCYYFGGCGCNNIRLDVKPHVR